MNYECEAEVCARSNALGPEGVFQAELRPNEVVSGRRLYERLAKHAGIKASMAQIYVKAVEGFVLEELAKGNRVDFDLASFYPRLSGSLSARDVDPLAEGVCVRGAVKARRELVEAPRKKVKPVNRLSNEHPRIFSVMDAVTGEGQRIAPEHEVKICGEQIPIDLAQEDEGIWLETRRRGVVAQAEVLSSEPNLARCIFHGPLAAGAYTLVLGTRCGKGRDFKVRRCLSKVKVV